MAGPNALLNNHGYSWISAEVNDVFGASGQNEGDPASMFLNHQFVKITSVAGVKYYDPSYEGDPFNSLQDFDNKLAGFYIDTTIGGVKARLFMENPNGLDVQEVPPT